jgi:acetylornithine deacetylase/succinyl-diaminopimelate desuccinylase-like protein
MRSLAASWAPAICCAPATTKPDLAIGAGFSYAVVTAHNGCLRLEMTVHGKAAHAAMPETGHGALQGSVRILAALFAERDADAGVSSTVAGIDVLRRHQHQPRTRPRHPAPRPAP